MLLKVDSKELYEYANYRIKYPIKGNQKKSNFKDKSKKIIKGLTGLAIIGAATTGYALYQKRRIKDLNFLGQSVANLAVYNSNSRGKETVNLYKKLIAHKKASVLKYKLNSGMFIGKSSKAIQHIKNNLENLNPI